MGSSFFRGTDAEVYTGSKSFSTQINATPTTFGLTAAQAAAYAALHAAYAAAYLESTNSYTRTQGKVAAKKMAKADLKSMASSLAKIIAGTPTVTNAQKITLGLSVRATPAPLPAPGAPDRFKVVLNADGSLELSWKGNNPPGASGTMYQVWRRLGEGELTYVGGTGERRFLDATVPVGTTTAMYQIQAVRSTVAGPWAQFNVNFGVTPVGTAMAKVGDAVKLAA